MQSLLIALALITPSISALAQQPTADSIMVRVAANQDHSEAERARYIYIQHARTSSRKGKTVMCEEITDYRVTPSDTGSTQQLLKLDGRLLQKHQYITYDTLSPKKEPVSDHEDSLDGMDRDLVENMRSNLTDDKSKDGIGAHLFPLTSKNQLDYEFHLLGQEQRNGREVFHLNFRPRDKDDYSWKGDAYIDTATYQPVLIRTTMARNLPFAVRTLLGTSLPGLGFTVAYAPQPDGVWFPTTFGTEFKIHFLFFFNREIILSADNRDFAKTHVSSQIVTDQAESPPPQ
jgi:hypothetical protein